MIVEQSVEDQAPEIARRLVEHRPKFIPGHQVTNETIAQAEVWVEGLGFGLRWKGKAEKAHVQPISPNSTCAKIDHRPVRNLDNDVRLQ